MGLTGTVGALEILANSIALAQTDAVAVTGGVFGGISGAVAISTVDPTIAASIGANANVEVGTTVLIESHSEADADAIATGVAVSAGLGVGVSVGIADIKPNISTFIDSGASIIAGTSISLLSSHNVNRAGTTRLSKGTSAKAVSGSGGLIGVSAAIAETDASPTQNTYVANSATLGGQTSAAITDIVLSSWTHNDVNVRANALAFGGVGVGVSIGHATIGGSTSTYVTGNVNNARDLTLTADSFNNAVVNVTAAAGGIGAGSGNEAKAIINPQISAYIDNSTDVSINGDIGVTASAIFQADVLASGINAGGVAVGASLADTTVSGSIDAHIGTNSTIDAANLTVTARQDKPGVGLFTAKAKASAATGGLVGINATDAKSTVNTVVNAFVGDNSTLIIDGKALIQGINDSNQLADVSGVQGGIVAVGANFANTFTAKTTTASLGSRVAVNANELTIFAGGSNGAGAIAVSGSGGLVSGTAAEGNTSSTAITTASIGNGAAGKQIKVNTLDIEARYTTAFNAKVSSINASVVGGSGAYSSHVVNSIVNVDIGGNTDIEARNLFVDAANLTRKTALPGGAENIISGSGGLIDIPATVSSSVVLNTTLINVGDGAKINLIGDRSNPGAFSMNVLNDIFARDKVKLESGGLIPVARAESNFIATNIGLITIGAADIDTVGDIVMGTYTKADVKTESLVKTWGFAAGAEASTLSLVTSNHQIVLETGADLRAEGEINLAAGRDSTDFSSSPSRFEITALTDFANRAAIPISTDPDADVVVTQTNLITVEQGAITRSVGDTDLITDSGILILKGEGNGKDFALGFIPFDRTAGSVTTTQDNGVIVEGEVHVGIRNQQILHIEVDKNAPNFLKEVQKSDGVTYSVINTTFGADIEARFTRLFELRSQYSGDATAVAAFNAEISFLEMQVARSGPRILDTPLSEILMHVQAAKTGAA